MTEKTIHPVIYAEMWRRVMAGAEFDEDGNVQGEADGFGSSFSAGFPSSVYQNPADEKWVWVWAEDFTPEQEAEWTALWKEARVASEPLPDLSDVYNTLRLYYRAEAPTTAQTVMALKGVIRVLREQAKDDD